LLVAAGFSVLACHQTRREPGRAPVQPADYRSEDYLRAKRKARAWFDQLEVDPVGLLERGINGKKKLGEILAAYWSLHEYETSPAVRQVLRRQFEARAAHAKRPEYHNMATCTRAEFNRSSMSYLTVMHLMKKMGMDTSEYLAQVRQVKPRMDDHLARRGPFQRAMFAEYYEQFGLEKPEILKDTEMGGGMIDRRLEVHEYDEWSPGERKPRYFDSYSLTHELFVAFDYGQQTPWDYFSAEDLAYARKVLPVLLDRYMLEDNTDLVAELFSCMTYLGMQGVPAYRAGLEYLLDSQNPDGTWGDYEAFREQYGPLLDQQGYLHTTMVAMRALLEAYERTWSNDGASSASSGAVNATPRKSRTNTP
jgi:hypothetical protein